MKKENTTATTTTINYESVKKALTSIDSRFTVFEEKDDENTVRNYCSIRLILADKTTDNKRLFCIYYSQKKVVIHCARRFETVCDSIYKLNAKKTEYTLSCDLSNLATYVHSLLAYECVQRKMSTYTKQTVTATEKKQQQKKAK